MLLGLFFGLGLAVGVGAFIEYFNQPIETEDDVRQATGLPVLGWLPAVESPELPTERRGEPLTLVESPSPRSIPAEGFRSIRTSLESLARHRDLRTLMLASAGPREGKSTVLLNLGWVFWELGRRLIVVDTDLRRPALHRALRSPAQSGVASGVADLLTATADVGWDKVGRLIKKDFLLLPAGASSGANPGALLIPEKIRRLLDGLKERADLILFDSAPILAVSDNLILASMVDGVILVVRVGRTQRRDLLRAKDQLDKVGAPLLGVVINGVPPRETRRYYAPYLDYYDPDAFPPSRMRPWNPRSWLRSPRTKRNGKKGDWR
jgi:capsular exopolysaccharide synthesis family protein